MGDNSRAESEQLREILDTARDWQRVLTECSELRDGLRPELEAAPSSPWSTLQVRGHTQVQNAFEHPVKTRCRPWRAVVYLFALASEFGIAFFDCKRLESGVTRHSEMCEGLDHTIGFQASRW